LSVNGNSNLATPNIDSLARDGTTFDNFYVSQVCAPTRAEFLTCPERSGDGAFWMGWGKSSVALRLPPHQKSAWPSDENRLATLGQAGSFHVHQYLK
jgi:arylsulfatase A-like enzyme